MGASFGGYATLGSLAFEPDLYRCGISMLGVTDLVAQIKNWKRPYWKSRQGTYAYDRWVTTLGDPEANADYLNSISPLYHADKINVPIMLIHGKSDKVVAAKQSKKMQKALDAQTAMMQEMRQMLQGPYNDTLVEFTPGDINPNLAAYTEQYYNLYPSAEDQYENLTQIEADRGALRNGDLPDNVYSLFRGSGRQFNEYSKYDRTQLRISASGSADIKNHTVSIGFEYEQRVDSWLQYAPSAMWTLADIRTIIPGL